VPPGTAFAIVEVAEVEPVARDVPMTAPASPSPARVVRVGAVADLHCTRTSQGQLQPLFARLAHAADVLLVAGDLTDHGLAEEAHVLARELTGIHVPLVAVLGNHDFESGKPEEVCRVLAETGVKVLDGDACEIHGIGFAGVKGFAGGFGRGTLGAWGEPVVKQFVREAVDETLKLEAALARLRMPQRIALMHYAPIPETVEGEPREIYPFLGCGRLAEPLHRYAVTAVFHGHAHRGTPEGRTAGGIPVYNVSLPLLRRTFPDRLPCHILEIAVES
jgi:Icc-related predicted phosphoesterase